MKALGYLLLTVGFLYGAYLTSLDPEEVPVGSFLVALAVAVAGVAMARLAIRRAARHEERVASNIAAIEESLASLVQKVGRMEQEKGEIDVYDLRHRIDDELMGDLDAFVQARESIAVSFSLQAYADVMSHFAAAERYLNRVWSASTDGYIDEAHAYITKALEQLHEARGLFQRLQEQGAGGATSPLPASPPPVG